MMKRICWNCMNFSWNGDQIGIEKEVEARPHEKLMHKGRCEETNRQVWLNDAQTAEDCPHYDPMDDNDPIPLEVTE